MDYSNARQMALPNIGIGLFIFKTLHDINVAS